ncbi:polyphosphate:AMP phosphotransferase [Cyclonatronum proteinivorum]|uniref:Polyphosphate:AMP phosphotransferase n=1 Tax=Cyclonatronum proteinivorum TaxID=1457365 RepID=A0A345ULI5_9BACT|nr:polyphosphate:AMP phosphotransferase [Cyclonatronum proteinivorum]AXJ01337.1 polyphosphate:AMP phosphotransferase [Cyclonatronum proteinivorum]
MIPYATAEKIKKNKDYNKIIERDRGALLLNQFRLRDAGVPVIILVSGTQTSGYTRVMNLLNEWMDTRFIQTHVHRPDSDEEADRPYFWKYWRQFPASGSTGLFLGGWYTQPFLDRLHGKCDLSCFRKRITGIKEMEQLLAVDGALIVKIWLHLDYDQKRQNKEEDTNNRPESTWQVTMDDWQGGYSYDKKMKLVTELTETTHQPHAPWYKIDATDARTCDISVMHLLTGVFSEYLKRGGPDTSAVNGRPLPEVTSKPLDRIDLGLEYKRKLYKKKMSYFWESIYVKAWQAHHRKKSVVVVLEGSDAAGKGGSIRRLIHCLDARLYQVIQIAAPTQEEKAHHYLWRFWMQIPRAGFLTIYDRSWYGRVLVERVEGFAEEEEWKRAYAEINHFEKQLTESGITVLKFWLQISKDEQMKRFKQREKTDYKQYKLTDEDWRNRKKWDEYADAVNDMLAYTDTDYAPWHLISAEDKKNARISLLEAVDTALAVHETDADNGTDPEEVMQG